MRQRSGETLTMCVVLLLLWWQSGMSWWWFGGAMLAGSLLNAWQMRDVWKQLRQQRRAEKYIAEMHADAAMAKVASEQAGGNHDDAT